MPDVRNGTVGLREFDLGVVTTLGAQRLQGPTKFGYYLTAKVIEDRLKALIYPAPLLNLSNIVPPNMPGLPVVFSHPENKERPYTIPYILVTRSDISPANGRYHPGTKQYKVPAVGAKEITSARDYTRLSWDKTETREAATPTDITYELTMVAHHRGSAVNFIGQYVKSIFPPYCVVYLTDTLGEPRRYYATAEALSSIDEVIDIEDRTLGWTMSIQVEAELDEAIPTVQQTVTGTTSSFSLLD